MDGWFGGSSEVGSKHGSSSSDKKRHHSSSRSIFGDFTSSSSHHSSSRPSFFNFGRSSSYYKRSPRRSYLQKLYTQLQQLLRKLLYYLKKKPLKVFMLVLVPLLTGGLLTALLARLGLRLPHGVETFIAQLGGHAPPARRPGLHFERQSYEGPLAGMGKALGAVGGIGGLMGLAKLF